MASETFLTEKDRSPSSQVTKFFLGLNDEDKNDVLSRLVSVSGPKQLVYLTDILPDLLFRDFAAHLPLELVYHILKYLDGQDLLCCCQVSKCWNVRIESLVDLWVNKTRKLGVIVPPVAFTDFDSEPVESSKTPFACGTDESIDLTMNALQLRGRMCKNLYMRAMNFMNRLKSGTAFEMPEFIHSAGSRISSLKVHQNRIFVGTENQVQVRALSDGEIISAFKTHSVANMKIKSSTLYTASYNATVELWDLTTCSKIETCYGHTGSVLSLDLSEDGRFLLTGSADRSAKLWDLTKESMELIVTLDGAHEHWVFKVNFLSCLKNSVNVITFDSTRIQVWTYDLLNHQIVSNGISAGQDILYLSAAFHQNSWETFSVSTLDKTSNTTEFLTFELTNNCTLPALEIKDRWCILEVKKPKILACGLKFLFVMTFYSVNRDCYIYDRHKKCLFAQICMTTSYTLPRHIDIIFSTVAIYDHSWLDGFHFERIPPSGPFLLVVCADSSTAMKLSWKSPSKP